MRPSASAALPRADASACLPVLPRPPWIYVVVQGAFRALEAPPFLPWLLGVASTLSWNWGVAKEAQLTLTLLPELLDFQRTFRIGLDYKVCCQDPYGYCFVFQRTELRFQEH